MGIVTADFKPDIPAGKNSGSVKATGSSYWVFVFCFFFKKTLTRCQCSRLCTEHWVRRHSLFTWLSDKKNTIYWEPVWWEQETALFWMWHIEEMGIKHLRTPYLVVTGLWDKNCELISHWSDISKIVCNCRISPITPCGQDGGSLAPLKNDFWPPLVTTPGLTWPLVFSECFLGDSAVPLPLVASVTESYLFFNQFSIYDDSFMQHSEEGRNHLGCLTNMFPLRKYPWT